jgi:hypothetical protein
LVIAVISGRHDRTATFCAGLGGSPHRHYLQDRLGVDGRQPELNGDFHLGDLGLLLKGGRLSSVLDHQPGLRGGPELPLGGAWSPSRLLPRRTARSPCRSP